MVKLDKRPFVEKAINTRCHAFFDELWFSLAHGEMGQEYYPELSCREVPPDWQTDMAGYEHINGTMCFLGQNGTLADLYLVCNYYNEIGEYYYVFWDCRDADHENGIRQWMVWLPNVKYPN